MYHRKYYIENILNRINEKHGINYENRQMVYKIFELIDKVKPEVNGDRKGLISINFLRFQGMMNCSSSPTSPSRGIGGLQPISRDTDNIGEMYIINAGGRRKRANERSVGYRPPVWR